MLFIVALSLLAFAPHTLAAWSALAPVAVLLAAEQKLGASLEPNAAFFQVNAWLGFFVLVCFSRLDMFLLLNVLLDESQGSTAGCSHKVGIGP